MTIPANAPRFRMSIYRSSRETQMYEVGLDAISILEEKQYATYTFRTVYGLSVYGPGSSIKAIAAALQQPRVRPMLSAWGFGGLHAKDSLRVGDEAFQCHQHRLGYDTWHLLALLKKPGLLPNFSQREIHRQLMSDRFTTPMLPHWVPYVAGKLVMMNRLARLKNFGHIDAGLMTATTKHTDAIVTAGIRSGELTFTTEALTDA